MSYSTLQKTEPKCRTGWRVRYTWDNSIIGAPPVSKLGTIRATRGDSHMVRVLFDGEAKVWGFWFSSAHVRSHLEFLGRAE